MFLAIVNGKGGVGKSTLAVHAAVWLHEQGKQVVVLDADAQGSSAEWLKRAAPEINVVQLPRATDILREAPSLQIGADVVVADGPAALGTTTVALLGVADRVLMPVGPSMLDVTASYRTARMIYRIRFTPARRGLPEAFTVFNRVQPRTRLARVAAMAILKYGFPVAPTVLQLRQAYAEACGRGSVVWRMGGGARDAANEIIELFGQVLDPARGSEVAAEQGAALRRAKDAVVLKERVRPAGELIANLARHPAEAFDGSDETAAIITSKPDTPI